MTGTTLIKPWYDEDGWIPGESFFDSLARRFPCIVQISDCEIAIIGGSAESFNTMDWIIIYNFEDKTWRRGPL